MYYKYRVEGVERDTAEAFRWFTKSAEQGHASSQYMLGKMYFYGEGVKQDYTEAVRCFTKGAEQGYVRAQNWLDRGNNLKGNTND